MATTLVVLPSGAGVVRADDGLVLITGDTSRGASGTYLRGADPFTPAKSWVDEDRSVVGGLLPPGAVGVEVVDDRGTRVTATVGGGAYAALLDQPVDGHRAIVCCRDTAGAPVRRPRPADYPSAPVTDATEPCPACGAMEYDEYTPFEQWRGGRRSPDGTTVPAPVVSCRVCGHDEPEGVFVSVGVDAPEPEDEATRSARAALARAERRQQYRLSTEATLRQTRFPIYGADGWVARLGGSSSRDGHLTEVTIDYYDMSDPDIAPGDRPRLAVTTRHEHPHVEPALVVARRTLDRWLHRHPAAGRWPDVSHAAVTLWLRAREREVRAAVLGAVRSEQPITIDGAPIETLMLTSADDRWVATTRHADREIVVAALGVAPDSLHLHLIGDPIGHLLGPTPPGV